LGLCAFVDAYPYQVPEFMPEFLMILGDHLHDSEPIPVSTFLNSFFFSNSFFPFSVQETRIKLIFSC
jgi:hypothetical protein